MVDAEPAAVSFGRRTRDLAAEKPDDIAIIFAPREGADREYSWATLERRALQIAGFLKARGVGQGDLVIVGLPNSPEHVFSTVAAWKLGACVLPLRADLPAWERERMIEVAEPKVTLGDWPEAPPDVVSSADLDATTDDPAEILEDCVADPATAIASSGSTGTPKIILRPGRGERAVEDLKRPYDRDPAAGATTELIPAPLYHTNGFYLLHMALFAGDRVVLMERFDAARAADLIESHPIVALTMVPTMLLRMARLPDFDTRDFSRIEAVVTGGASCPDWLARRWIERVGPQRFIFSYGSTEGVGITYISGDEWLEHPGSVGTGRDTEIRILDPQERELPTGEVGEIFMHKTDTDEPTYQYVGAAPAKQTDDGFTSIGDMGWLDADGYLYVADRRVDMIISGGANVFPAEVEAALLEHPGVFDAVVIGLPDPDWGQRVHALVQPLDAAAAPSVDVLRTHCRERLAAYKVPKAFEHVARLPRSDAGKLNRARLVDERA
ncbi:MAG: AMP-binding protein [Myxococcales bacterium]|nr:AMP-binding protein [Myxococcales bacterium]